MNKTENKITIAVFISLGFVLMGALLNPVLGMINPWIFLPMIPIGYIMSIKKDVKTFIFLIVCLAMISAFELTITQSNESWKFDFHGIGVAYILTPIFVSSYITYHLVNHMYVSQKFKNKINEKKIATCAMITIFITSSLCKFLMILLTNTNYRWG